MRVLLVFILFLTAHFVLAQDSSIQDASVRDVLESGKKTEQLIEEHSQ